MKADFCPGAKAIVNCNLKMFGAGDVIPVVIAVERYYIKGLTKIDLRI
jgi:hypothetical protein